MEKGLVLPVEVGDKVLRAFGQVQNGLEVDNLAAGRLYRGVLLGQELQIAQFFLGKTSFSASFHCLLCICRVVYPHYFTFSRRLQDVFQHLT